MNIFKRKTKHSRRSAETKHKLAEHFYKLFVLEPKIKYKLDKRLA
jgi:hypothetical protein